jgi:toxin-antitoxin system PIN domain toxin
VTELAAVNVLVPLAWPNHVHPAQSRAWFAEFGMSGWATCPITEAGFVRVYSNRRVIADARSVGETVDVLKALRAIGRHHFCSDDMSPVDSPGVNFETLSGYRQVTDAKLASLAGRHGGRFVMFDAGAAALGRAHGIKVRLLNL